MRRAAFLFLLTLTLVVGGVVESHAAKRVALVIGNSTYQHTTFLPNPQSDAEAISNTFKRIGFDKVTLKIDQDIDSMRSALREFEVEADGAETAVVFFAGHGMEMGGENYLIPVDAKLQKDRHLTFEAIKLSSVLRSVEGAKSLRLVILDACRNNPFAASMRVSSGAKRSVARGFGRFEPKGDILVAYAARHGTTADDGSGRHSPYTSALLTHLAEPGVDIRLLMGRIRDKVRTTTGGAQVPHTYGTLGGGSVFLVPPKPGSKASRMAALQKKLLELERKLADKPTAETMDRGELTRTLQAELKRVGCDPGNVDGRWGEGSRRALSRFNQHANLRLSTAEPTGKAIDVLKGIITPVCPPTCGQGYRLQGSNCVRVKEAPTSPHRQKTVVIKKKSPKCRLETRAECARRLAGSGLRGTGACDPQRRRRTCR